MLPRTKVRSTFLLVHVLPYPVEVGRIDLGSLDVRVDTRNVEGRWPS